MNIPYANAIAYADPDYRATFKKSVFKFLDGALPKEEKPNGEILKRAQTLVNLQAA